MGGYRLPVTPYNPPQQQNPLEMLAGVQSIKNQQQQGQAITLENQQRQIALNDQKAMTSAMHEWDGSNYDSLIPLVVKNGGSANAVIGLKQKLLEQQKTKSDIAAQDATTGSKNLETLSKKNDLIAGQLKNVMGLPDDQLSAGLVSAAQEMASTQGPDGKPLLDPQHVQMAQSIAQSGASPADIRTQLDFFRKHYMADSAQNDEAAKQAEAFKNTQQGNEAQVNTDVAKSRAAWYQKQGLAPGINPEEAGMADWLAKNPGKGPSDYQIAMKKIVPAYNFNLQNQGLAGQAGQPSALAQAVAKGDMKWSDVISPRTPQSVKEQFAQEVMALNPKFDSAQFGIQAKAAEKATSGTWADTRIAYNTALDHSQQLLSALDALDNGDIKKFNSLRNYFKTEMGSPVVPTYSAIANAYNHEVTQVVSKGHITDAEVKTGGAVLPDNASPQQIKSVVGAYNSLMQSKRDELDKQIKAGAGDKANSVLQNRGGSGNQPPAGATHIGTSSVDGKRYYLDANNKKLGPA